MKRIGLKLVVLGVGVLAMSASMAHSKIGTVTFAQSKSLSVVNTGSSGITSGWADQCPGHSGDNGLACPVNFRGMVAESEAAKATYGRRSSFAMGGV